MDSRLRVYVGADQRFEHISTSEWLLHRAQQFGLPGGTALTASAGYGPHGRRKNLGLDSLSADDTQVVELVAERQMLQTFLAQILQTSALDRALITLEGVEVVEVVDPPAT